MKPYRCTMQVDDLLNIPVRCKSHAIWYSVNFFFCRRERHLTAITNPKQFCPLMQTNRSTMIALLINS